MIKRDFFLENIKGAHTHKTERTKIPKMIKYISGYKKYTKKLGLKVFPLSNFAIVG
ncbi:hypothetical protein [Mobilisporobacter senegalensis]|uniref:hypothetical protein n=1 Tax=Mobilisporobacter senegalensis TaxID=1329262 RepID=UPI0014729BD6|nr:hypothetical protein [Mobilisporobacter senegalensis]